jgi:hypothetical protein
MEKASAAPPKPATLERPRRALAAASSPLPQCRNSCSNWYLNKKMDT